MLRLNVYCSVVPTPRPIRLGGSYRPWLIGCRQAHSRLARVYIRAVKDENNGGNSSSPGQRWDPGLEVEVPYEQRPVNEYSSLKDGALYSWGELGAGPFFIRLGVLWLVTFTILGVPISAASFNPSREPLRFVLAAGTGTLFLVSLIVLRIYLGWSYVGDRLLSAVIPYEESGWYDGQMWAKPPEILARDRLLGSYKVKPVIKLLKQTLVGTGAVLVTAVLLFIFATPVQDFFQNTFSTKRTTPEPASDISTNYSFKKEELLRPPAEVKTNDELAAAAAQAANGRPVYCRDRYYRALAGGQYCKWEDAMLQIEEHSKPRRNFPILPIPLPNQAFRDLAISNDYFLVQRIISDRTQIRLLDLPRIAVVFFLLSIDLVINQLDTVAAYITLVNDFTFNSIK